jgi:hypothetical protein
VSTPGKNIYVNNNYSEEDIKISFQNIQILGKFMIITAQCQSVPAAEFLIPGCFGKPGGSSFRAGNQRPKAALVYQWVQTN